MSSENERAGTHGAHAPRLLDQRRYCFPQASMSHGFQQGLTLGAHDKHSINDSCAGLVVDFRCRARIQIFKRTRLDSHPAAAHDRAAFSGSQLDAVAPQLSAGCERAIGSAEDGDWPRHIRQFETRINDEHDAAHWQIFAYFWHDWQRTQE